MRRIRLLFWALALTLIPHHIQAADSRDYKEAEKLALQERYEEAVALMLPLPSSTSEKLHALRGLCTTYSLWGKNAEALDACSQGLSLPLFAWANKCIDVALRNRGRFPSDRPCDGIAKDFPFILHFNAWQAVAYHRSGRKDESHKSLKVAGLLVDELHSDIVLLSAIAAYLSNTFELWDWHYRHHGQAEAAAQLEHLRIVLTYGGAGNPAARYWRLARVLYAEHPYAKPALYALGALALCAALYVPAKRPLKMLATGAFHAARPIPRHVNRLLRVLAAGAFRAATIILRRVNLWLHPETSPRPARAPARSYAPAPAPAMPMYYNMRYPNQAYRIAGYSWAAFWIVLAGPIALALLLPAGTLLMDFSTTGFQNAHNNFFRILNASLSWARLWFALLLFSLIGFVSFKLYGRFSLPKRMRPPIRVVYGTLRFVFLGTILASIGTFLSYFTAAFAGIYASPFVKPLIALIRKLLGI